jgi:O-antigen/teichoic acid export membrane protein
VRGPQQPVVKHLLKFWRFVAGTELRRNVLETYSTRLLVAALSFTTTVVISRTLGPDGRGLYAVAITISAIGVQFGNLGLNSSNNYYVAKDRGLLPALMGNTLAVVSAAAVVAALIGMGFVFWPSRAPLHGVLFVLVLASAPVGLAYLLSQGLLLGVNEVRTYNAIEYFGKLAALLLISAAAVAHVATVELLFGIYLFSLILSFMWALLRLRRVSTSPPALSLGVFRQSIDIGIRAYLVLFFGFLVLRIDLLMVQYLRGEADAGYYSVSQVLSENLMMLPVIIGLLLFPKLSGMKDHEEKSKLAIRASLLTAALMMPVVVAAALAAGPIISITFGPSFLSAVAPFVWLTPGIYFLGIEIVMVQLLNSEGFPPIIVVAWIIDAIANVALNFWAIPRYGMIGASVVSSVCYFLMFVIVAAVIWERAHARRRVSVVARPHSAPIV